VAGQEGLIFGFMLRCVKLTWLLVFNCGALSIKEHAQFLIIYHFKLQLASLWYFLVLKEFPLEYINLLTSFTHLKL
jgi:hypothetical protein